jgi:hypothetical protein
MIAPFDGVSGVAVLIQRHTIYRDNAHCLRSVRKDKREIAEAFNTRQSCRSAVSTWALQLMLGGLLEHEPLHQVARDGGFVFAFENHALPFERTHRFLDKERVSR